MDRRLQIDVRNLNPKQVSRIRRRVLDCRGLDRWRTLTSDQANLYENAILPTYARKKLLRRNAIVKISRKGLKELMGRKG